MNSLRLHWHKVRLIREVCDILHFGQHVLGAKLLYSFTAMISGAAYDSPVYEFSERVREQHLCQKI